MGAENGVRSCDLAIFVDEPAESISALDGAGAWSYSANDTAIRRPLVQRSVRPMSVEMIDVLGQHLFQMVPVHNEHPVQAFVDVWSQDSLDGLFSGDA